MDDDSCRSDIFPPSRKRLAPQLIYKGSILKAWGKSKRSPARRFLQHVVASADHRSCTQILFADLWAGSDATGQRYRLAHRRTEHA